MVMLTGMLMVPSKMGAMRTMSWVLMPVFLRTRMMKNMAVVNLDMDGMCVTVVITDHMPSKITVCWMIVDLDS